MAKVKRNDPCPCGSGKKYRWCCMNKSLNPSISPVGNYALPKGILVDRYSEEDVLKQLINSSKEFQKFYEAEKGNIGSIFWLKSNKDIEVSLGFVKGQKAKYSRIFNKNVTEKLIILEQIPPLLDDAILIAHEIGHDLIFNNGFPGVSPNLKNVIENEERGARFRLTSALSSMIHDILCDSYLKKYGFVYEKIYQAKIKGHLRNMRGFDERRVDTFDRLAWVFQYVLTNLQGSIIVDNPNGELQKYNNFYEKRFPKIALEGQIILDLIEIIGYDTPDNLEELYQEIFEKYNLKHICILLYPE